jgi:thiol-disulfide isomerase/thioredoxin
MTTGGITLAALLVVTALVAVVWRSRQGVVRAPRPSGALDWPAQLHALGLRPGERATFVQLSAEVCAPCRATARVLRALVSGEPGVVHAELDVDRHLDLVRAAGVLRTPTVLVLDGAGAEVARSSGAMTPAQARAALAVVGQDAGQTVDEGRSA